MALVHNHAPSLIFSAASCAGHEIGTGSAPGSGWAALYQCRPRGRNDRRAASGYGETELLRLGLGAQLPRAPCKRMAACVAHFAKPPRPVSTIYTPRASGLKGGFRVRLSGSEHVNIYRQVLGISEPSALKASRLYHDLVALTRGRYQFCLSAPPRSEIKEANLDAERNVAPQPAAVDAACARTQVPARRCRGFC